jgi:hypothetical protein
VGGKQTLDVTGNRTVHVKGSQSVTIDGSSAADGMSGSKVFVVTGDHMLDTTKTIAVQAPTRIELNATWRATASRGRSAPSRVTRSMSRRERCLLITST